MQESSPQACALASKQPKLAKAINPMYNLTFFIAYCFWQYKDNRRAKSAVILNIKQLEKSP